LSSAQAQPSVYHVLSTKSEGLIGSSPQQYTTDRGNIPTRVLAHQIDRAPPPGQRTASRYPREYRNQEGPTNTPTRNFHPFELRREAELHEYPITGANQRQFDFDRRSARAHQVERPIHPNDRGRYVRHPQNDPGPIRGVVDQHGNIVGAMAHPAGNARGYQRAHLEPLNRQGRQDSRRYQDRITPSKAPTWPPR